MRVGAGGLDAASRSLRGGRDGGDDRAVLALALALLVTTAVDGEPGPAGVQLGLSAGGGVVGGDAVAGVDVVMGVGTAPFSFFVRAPLILRLVDRAPVVDAAAPSFCRALRCEELLQGERLDPTALARLVDEIRLFSPGDPVRARAGRLLVTIGDGSVVDRFTTAASWDRRTSGALLALRTPWHHASLDVVVADVLSPAELVAARVELAPLSAGGDDGFAPLRVSLDAGLDAFAPTTATDRKGESSPRAPTRPVSTSVLATRLVLGDGVWSLSPRVLAGVSTGFAPDGGPRWTPGLGAGVGLDIGVRTLPAQVRARATVGAGTDGFRHALFSTLYLVERRRALLGAGTDGDGDGAPMGLARVPAPAGVFFDGRIEASVLDAVAPLVRLHVGPAPGESVLEAGVVLDEGPLRLSLLAQRRGLAGAADVVEADLARFPVVGVVEAAVRVWGPVSVGGRWLRLPRFAGDGALRIDDDVWGFVAIDGLFAFP